MSNTVKKNDWIAINLNAPENMTIDMLPVYGITSDNTGIQSEDYYKNKKQVLDSPLFQNDDGTFNDAKFHAYYESALRTFNEYQNVNFTQNLIDSIEKTAYDVFSPFESPKFDDSAYLYNMRDPRRTTHGLGNIFESGSPVFDEREVAQANKMRDENGNVLDWTPNDRGGFFEGLFRPSAAMAIYENDVFDEDGRLIHHKGEYKLDEKGDPYYEVLGNKSTAGRETLKYWDTLTDDDSPWNKIDFFDGDGLKKSVGGTLMKTAVTLLPYFIPGVGEVLGYVGASVALGQALPVLGKALDAILTGSTNNDFGNAMYAVGNWFDRFRSSQSREAQGKFFSLENIGDIVSSSAGQLFQQRNIAELSRKVFTGLDAMQAAKLGRGLSYGYMAVTSGEEAYDKFKEAGASDAVAGIATLATMGAFYGLFHADYFKEYMFTNTFMDEDIALTQTMKEIIDRNAVPVYKRYSEHIAKKGMTELERRLENVKLYTTIRDKVKIELEKLAQKSPRKTVKQLMEEEAANKKGIDFKQRLGMYITRAANEGFEETFEEVMQDMTKGVTLGLQALGVNVTEEGKDLNFGLSIRDMASRYMQSFIGGAIGGAIFESFNHWEGGPYDSLLEKDLEERLVWYYRNGYGNEIDDRLEKLRKKGKLGNVGLSAKPLRMKSVTGESDMVVFGQGTDEDNQNEAVYNAIRTYLDVLQGTMQDEQIFTPDNTLFKDMFEKLNANKEYDSKNPAQNLYHFLETIDEAKAKTIKQMNFLRLVSGDLNKLAVDILEKDKEIEAHKEKIRRSNHLTDADSSKEKELFSKNEYLKQLEKEKKELKERYESIVNGESAGWYMGFAHMQGSPKYQRLYQNPNFIKDQVLTGFPKTDLENFVLARTGMNYSSITDPDLKARLESDYDAFKKLADNDFDKLRSLYEIHLNLGQQFTPDIMKQNQEFAEWQQVDPIDFVRNYISEYATGSSDVVLNQAVAEFDAKLKEAEVIEDEKEKASAIDNAFTLLVLSTFGNPIVKPRINENDISTDLERTIVAGFDIRRGIQFLEDLAKKAVESKGIIDLSQIRKLVVSKIVAQLESMQGQKIKLQPDENLVTRLITSTFNLDYEKFDLDSIETTEDAIVWLEERFSSNVVDEILNAARRDGTDEIDINDIKNAYEDYKDEHYALLYEGDSRKYLKTLIDTLKQAILDGDTNIQEKEKAVLDYIVANSPYTRDEAKQKLNAIINPIGYDLVKATNDYNNIVDQLKTNPVLDLVRKLDISQGGKLFNLLSMIESEEALRNQNPNDYKFSSPEIEKQFEVGLSYLSAIYAVLESSLDGMNEAINTTSEFQYAVSDDAMRPLYEQGIAILVTRINALQELSKQNQQKTTTAQQKTDINTKAERIKTLTGIGTLTFDDTAKVDFASIWESIGFSLSDASIANAVDFSEAYDKFVSEVSKQLHTIFSDYKGKEHFNEFLDTIIKTFGEDVYMQDPGEVGEEPIVTPYNNALWIIRQTVSDPDELNSLWKTACQNNPQLMSLFGQENAATEVLAHIIDFFDGTNLFDKFHERLKKTFPEAKTNNIHYTENKDVAEQFANIDGIGGVGKTQGVAYLVLQMLKLKYEDISVLAMSVQKEAVEGLQEALDQKKETPVQGVTFSDFVEAFKDVFDYHSATKIIGNEQGKEGYLVFSEEDKNKNSISAITEEKIKQFFGDGKRILFLDESGLLDRIDAGFLLKLAKQHKIFIVGSGDMFQNQALVRGSDTATSGFEDFFYHKIAPLMVSMRAEYNGQYNNTIVVRNIQNEIRKRLNAKGKTDFNVDAYNDETEKVLTGHELFYAPSNFAGTSIAKSGDVENIISELEKQIKKLKENDPERPHIIAIAVSDDEHYNKYKTKYEGNDNIQVWYANKIQGREFDYIVVDKTYNINAKYIGIKDFYTMMTRPKIGSVFVDDANFIKNQFRITFTPNENAALPVMGGTAEAKRAIFKLYIDWKNALMEKYPLYTRAEAQTTGAKSGSESPASPASTAGAVQIPIKEEMKPVTYEILGKEELSEEEQKKLDEIKYDPVKRTEFYAQRIQQRYYRNMYEKRQKILTGTGSIDFDHFVDELKNTDNTKFEDLPGTIFAEESKSIESARFAYRVLIAHIARGILNNKPENRKQYFIDSTEFMDNFIRTAGVYDFRSDLQASFNENGDGIFVARGDYMYYGFAGSNGKHYLIPIYALKSSLTKNSVEYFSKNLTFNIEVGSIPISTNGEMRFAFNDILNAIDGILTTPDGKSPKFAVAIPNQDVLNTIKAQLKVGNADAAIALLNRMSDMSGKTFYAHTAASPTWRTFKQIFELLQEGNNIESLVQKLYDPNDDTQPFDLGALQKDLTFDKWLNLVAILSKLHNGIKLIPSEEEYILGFFNESIQDSENFVKRTQSITGDNASNIAKRLGILKEYKVLHTSSTNSLSSALIRYVQQLPEGNSLKERFLENFTKWFSTYTTSTDNGERMHFRGFIVRIATKDDADNKIIHYFRVLPKADGNGYTIDYTDNVNSDIITKLLDSEDKINTLFDGINYNFLNVIKTVLSSIRGNTKTIGGRNVSMDNIVASVFNGEELSEEAFRSGTLELYPIDAYYDVHPDKDNKIVVDKNEIPRNYFSPYESELYAWLTKKDGKYVQLNNASEIDDFLKKDSKFKYGLFAHIRARFPSNTESKTIWSDAIDNNPSGYSIDISKVIQPTYSVNTTGSRIQLDTNPEVNENYGKLFETSTELESEQAAIKYNEGLLVLDGAIGKGDFIVNSAWLADNLPDLEIEPADTYTITEVGFLTGFITINGKDVRSENTITAFGKYFKNFVPENIIVGKDFKIYGNRILIQDESGIITTSFEVIGKNYNTGRVLIRYNNIWKELALIDEQIDNLPNIAVAEDNYVSYYIDPNAGNVAIYYDGSNYMISGHTPDAPMTVVTYATIAEYLPKSLQKASVSDVSNLKVYTNNGMTIFVGSHMITADDLRSWVQTSIEDGIYTLIAMSGNQLVVEDADNNRIELQITNPAAVKSVIGDTNLGLKQYLKDLGVEQDLLEQIVDNNKLKSPAQYLDFLISQYNKIKADQYAADLDGSSPMVQLEFTNSNFTLIEKRDYTVETERLIWQQLKKEGVNEYPTFVDTDDRNVLGVQYNLNGKSYKAYFKRLGDDVERYNPNEAPPSIIVKLKEELNTRRGEITDIKALGVTVAQENALNEEDEQLAKKIALLEACERYLTDRKLIPDIRQLIPLFGEDIGKQLQQYIYEEIKKVKQKC